jgi:hypothetical protein
VNGCQRWGTTGEKLLRKVVITVIHIILDKRYVDGMEKVTSGGRETVKDLN